MPTATTIAALYDIHGNLPALEAVLAELQERQPELIVIGGDVAWGPMPGECVDLLASLGSTMIAIRGNSDRELVEQFDALRDGANPSDEMHDQVTRWAADQLSEGQRDWLAALPISATVDVAGLGSVRFCHGSPRSDDEIITSISPEHRLCPMLEGVREPVVVCGHTHVQFDRHVAGKRIVNAGSVGMPYAPAPGAYWALLGPAIELRQTPYDMEAAARQLHQSGMPGIEEFIRGNVLTVPDPDEATAHFERMAEEREARAR